MPLLTVGHGTLTASRLVALLRDAGVTLLVDIRAYPASRRNPQFNRDALLTTLGAAGVAYRHEPRLGGRRRGHEASPHVAIRNTSFRAYADHMQSQEFQEALSDLLSEAAGRTTAIMCAERGWWRCHRRLVADGAVLLHGTDVHHLDHDGRLAPHHPIEVARVHGSELIYDVGSQLAQPPA
ncbi:MAG TPA: DUF488 domain-containing protein [Nitriliruptorales bacterium]|nr:DUF488 domain-containing protein [Nitriliruptorales bacterium]